MTDKKKKSWGVLDAIFGNKTKGKTGKQQYKIVEKATSPSEEELKKALERHSADDKAPELNMHAGIPIKRLMKMVVAESFSQSEVCAVLEGMSEDEHKAYAERLGEIGNKIKDMLLEEEDLNPAIAYTILQAVDHWFTETVAGNLFDISNVKMEQPPTDQGNFDLKFALVADRNKAFGRFLQDVGGGKVEKFIQTIRGDKKKETKGKNPWLQSVATPMEESDE